MSNVKEQTELSLVQTDTGEYLIQDTYPDGTLVNLHYLSGEVANLAHASWEVIEPNCGEEFWPAVERACVVICQRDGWTQCLRTIAAIYAGYMSRREIAEEFADTYKAALGK